MIRKIIEQFPGIGCAWTDTAGNESTEYYGVADRENNTAVDGDTIFPACSVSKFVTAICVMKLHEILENTFFASREKTVLFAGRMAAGYDDHGLPIPGNSLRFRTWQHPDCGVRRKNC